MKIQNKIKFDKFTILQYTRWASTFRFTKCRTIDILEFPNFVY